MGITVKLVTIVTGALASLLITAATISPSDADSNVAAWLKVLGVDSPHRSLVSSSADYWLIALAGLFALICIVGSFEWFFGKTVVATRIKQWLRRNVWWRFGKSRPVGKQTERSEVIGALERPNFDTEKTDEFNYPYPKAVIKLRNQNPKGVMRGDSSGKPIAMALTAQLQNDHKDTLKNCSVVLREIEGLDDGKELVGLQFKLPKDGTVQKATNLVSQFTLVRRDMSDPITPEPFLLQIGGRQVALGEESTYVLGLELRCESPHSTMARIQIDTGENLNAELRIIDQNVIERTD